MQVAGKLSKQSRKQPPSLLPHIVYCPLHFLDTTTAPHVHSNIYTTLSCHHHCPTRPQQYLHYTFLTPPLPHTSTAIFTLHFLVTTTAPHVHSNIHIHFLVTTTAPHVNSNIDKSPGNSSRTTLKRTPMSTTSFLIKKHTTRKINSSTTIINRKLHNKGRSLISPTNPPTKFADNRFCFPVEVLHVTFTCKKVTPVLAQTLSQILGVLTAIRTNLLITHSASPSYA